jgi:hypothetical protein
LHRFLLARRLPASVHSLAPLSCTIIELGRLLARPAGAGED